MSGRNHSRAGRPSVTPHDGAFVTGQRLLDFAANAHAVATLLPTHAGYGFARLCGDYTKLGGKPFKGTESVIEIQAWLRSCDRIFSHMNLSDLHCVQVASSML